MAQGKLMPNEQKRLLGNPGRRPIPEPVAWLEPAQGIPAPPDHLELEGQQVWLRLWSHAHAWLSPSTDLALLERYCTATDDRQRLRAVIETEGLMTTTGKGTPAVHPAWRSLRELERDLLAMEAKLGLTPQDRTKLGLAEVRKQSGMEALRNRGMDAVIIDTTEVSDTTTN